MFTMLRRLLIGSPLPSWKELEERLPKVLALPIFASDAMSSVAYATEEILLVLLLAGAIAIHSPLVMVISVAIVVLLAMVATSYRQTIRAYPGGGGAYIVAKENIGDYAGLTAGAALTIDYTLTVAVSIASGVAAFVSAFPEYGDHRVVLCVVLIAVVALANLRGARESGLLFAAPTYLFILSAFALIGVGIYKDLVLGLDMPSSKAIPPAAHTLTLFLVLRAFSGGCAAMTGTEAISNAVQAFRPPESKNAAATLMLMAAVLGVMFLGIGFLAWQTGVIPQEHETVLSQLARATFGTTWFYYVIQIATMLILVLAANTSFAGFPRLASIMARDRFLPRQLFNVGDRLVYSNGIGILALLAVFLVVLFQGDTHMLIPLYAVGVFLSFTLSQYGMVKRAIRLKETGWRRSAAISGTGAAATAVVTVVIASTKFLSGAWIVVFLIPCFVYVFHKIHTHYIELGNQLRISDERPFEPVNNTVLVLTPSLHNGVLQALEYAKNLSPDVRAIHVEVDPVDTTIMIDAWEKWGGGIPLVILESPYRSLFSPLMQYLEEVKHEQKNGMVTVVIPEFVPAKWWHKLLHNQSGMRLKLALLFRKGIVTANVRYYVGK